MISYVVKITKEDMLKFGPHYPEMHLCYFVNDQLREMHAPFVDANFLHPETWHKKIRNLYTSVSISSTKDGITYMFRLGEKDGVN